MSKTFATRTNTFATGTNTFATGPVSGGGSVIESFGSYTTDSDLWVANGGPYKSGHDDVDSQSRWTLKTDRYTTDGQALSLKDNSGYDTIYSEPGDGLSHYLSRGDTWEWYANADNGDAKIRQVWGHQSTEYQLYKFSCRFKDDLVGVWRQDGKNDITNLKTVENVGLSYDDWIRVETYWSDGNRSGYVAGDHEFVVERVDSFDANGFADQTTHLTSFSVHDDTYSGHGQGWGFAGDTTGQWWDTLRLLE